MAPSSSPSDPESGGRFCSGGADEGEKEKGSALLENLHSLVNKLLSLVSLKESCAGDAFDLDLSASCAVVQALVSRLSDWAFEQLRSRFEAIVSACQVLRSPEAASGLCGADDCVLSSSSLGDFGLLLRCCMNMLSLLEFDLNICLAKSQLLMMMLRELCPPNIVFQERAKNCGSISGVVTGSESFHQDTTSLSVLYFRQILVIFADELLLQRNLRKHFTVAYYISGTSERFPVQDFVSCDISIILEVIAAHFLLSFPETSHFGLSSKPKCSFKVVHTVSPKLSLVAALALLGTPAILSAPYMLQSHVILLVSRCLAADKGQDLAVMNCYISAFEQSVILYACHSSRSTHFNDLVEPESQPRSFVVEHHIFDKGLGLKFDSYVREGTYEMVTLHCQKLAAHCSSQSIYFSKFKEDIMSACMSCIKEKQHLIQEKSREEMCLILRYVIEMLAREICNSPSQKNDKIKWEDIYYGASLLDLMASSLLKVVEVLSECGTKTLSNYPLCKDYESVSGIIELLTGRFVEKYILCDVKAVNSSKQKRTKLMLAHFITLLFHSIDARSYPLLNGCIFVTIAVMSLLTFEEGNLDAINAMYGYVRETHDSAPKAAMGMSPRRSSLRIASDFQKNQSFHKKRTPPVLTYEASRKYVGRGCIKSRNGFSATSPIDAVRECCSEENKDCNGEAFLKCFLGGRSVPDWDDLSNFIQATPGKDYELWLQKREKFNKWKNKKMAVMRRQKKKKLRQLTSS